MRRFAIAVVLVVVMGAAYGLGRRYPRVPMVGAGAKRVLYYVDPMHPTYRSDKPGIAPDCGMALTPVYAGAGDTPQSASKTQLPAGAVMIDGATQQLLGIRTAAAEKSTSTRTVRVVGRVAPEDQLEYRVNSGVDGFVRETNGDSVGTRVHKDQKLATYFSPEFLPAASGFLAAVQSVPGSAGKDGARTMPFPGALSKQGVSSLQGYWDRLRNMGMGDAQITRMADNHQLPESIDVVAPAEGFILGRNISPGQHFERNMEFYRIADLSRVWVVAEVFERESSYLHPGGSAQLTLRGEGRRMSARIADSLPQSDVGGGTVQLRLEADNPNFLLRPDMLVDVELPVHLPAAVTVPLDAVLDSGSLARVYVERSTGVFEPRDVETGWRYDDRIEILRGLMPGERVVAAATFLVDSESRLKAPAAQPMAAHQNGASPAPPAHVAAVAHSVTDPNCGMAIDSAKSAVSGNVLALGGTTYYFCSRQCKEAFQNNNTSGSAAMRRGGRP